MKGLSAPPPVDSTVVPTSQNCWNLPASKLGWPRELGLLKQAFDSKTLRNRAISIPHHARQKPAHGLDEQAGSHLAPRQNNIAYADFAIDQVLPNTMVDALVSTAQKTEPPKFRKFSCHRLVETATPRGQHQQRTRRVNRLNALEDRLSPHEHSCSSPKRRIINRSMSIVGVIPRVMAAEVEQASLAGSAQHTV
jgi:hypothetical protein